MKPVDVTYSNPVEEIITMTPLQKSRTRMALALMRKEIYKGTVPNAEKIKRRKAGKAQRAARKASR